MKKTEEQIKLNKNYFPSRSSGFFACTSKKSAFTLIEVMVAVALFAILASAALASYSVLAQTTKSAREKTILSSLASEYLEIVRNMPYSSVGTISGNPHGNLPDLSNAVNVQIESFSYKVYYEVTYIDDPADGTILAGTDAAPNDYKQVKMFVLNTQTSQVTAFFTNVSPKGLEGINNAGALLIKVFNSQGQPVPGANLHIVNTSGGLNIILDRQADATGQWVEVGLPASVNGYNITATKTGYSSDQTYPITVANPNPTKPDATIVNGTVTQVSFFIDNLSSLSIRTLNNTCQSISGVNMNVRGGKLIGLSPTVYKFDQNFSSSGGRVDLNNLEWDTYTPTLLTGQSWVVRGTSPIQKIDVLPGTSQVFTMILDTNSTANSLLVIVKDAATGAAIEGASVHLKRNSPTQDYYGVTGGSVWVQLDWDGGSGTTNWSTSTSSSYFQDDGNIDPAGTPSGVRLKQVAGSYLPAGWIESSTFDTGTSASNFSTISWAPTSQNASTTLQLQVASSNNPNGPWNYVGPDGTSSTYYAVPGTSISSVNDSNRYVRYKAFLSTIDSTQTPVLTSVSINYVSGCFTPGQVWFPDLTQTSHDLDVSMPGYQTQSFSNLNINNNQTLEVLMGP